MIIKNKKYISISEVSEILNIKQHVIRYWDSQFNGVSTRLGDRKRRFFNVKNIKKLQTLKQLLHTDGKSHHSLALAKMMIDGNKIEKEFNLSTTKIKNKDNNNQLIKISDSLSKLLK